MATMRDVLDKRLRPRVVLIYAGLAAFFAFQMVRIALDAPFWLFGSVALLAFAVTLGASLSSWSALRCLACGKRLFHLLYGNGLRLRIDRQLRCCPFCGWQMDAPLPDGSPQRGLGESN